MDRTAEILWGMYQDRPELLTREELRTIEDAKREARAAGVVAAAQLLSGWVEEPTERPQEVFKGLASRIAWYVHNGNWDHPGDGEDGQ
jgi:hypothetical protein